MEIVKVKNSVDDNILMYDQTKIDYMIKALNSEKEYRESHIDQKNSIAEHKEIKKLARVVKKLESSKDNDVFRVNFSNSETDTLIRYIQNYETNNLGTCNLSLHVASDLITARGEELYNDIALDTLINENVISDYSDMVDKWTAEATKYDEYSESLEVDIKKCTNTSLKGYLIKWRDVVVNARDIARDNMTRARFLYHLSKGAYNKFIDEVICDDCYNSEMRKAANAYIQLHFCTVDIYGELIGDDAEEIILDYYIEEAPDILNCNVMPISLAYNPDNVSIQ